MSGPGRKLIRNIDYEWLSYGSYLGGLTVVTKLVTLFIPLYEVTESCPLPDAKSTQQVELHALTRACLLAKDKISSIYTDSMYAFRIAYDFGRLWK